VEHANTRAALNQLLTQLLTQLGPLPPPAQLPPTAQAIQAGTTWLQTSPVFEPALRAALQQVLTCHAQVVYQPYLTSTTTGLLLAQERAYASAGLPTEAYRLLGLFRYWNLIQYYYPYTYAIAANWQTLLPRFVPLFQHAVTPLAYHLLVAEVVAQLHDTHGFLTSPVLSAHFGDYLPPLEVRGVGGQVVITHVYEANLPVQVGDVLVRVNGQSIHSLLARYAPYVAASNQAAAHREALQLVLRGAQRDSLRLIVQPLQGRRRQVSLARTLHWETTPATTVSYKDYYYARNLMDTARIWQLLPGNIGYLHLGGLRPEQVRPVMDRFHATRGLVLDLRAYPQAGISALSSYLSSQAIPYATFRHPLLAYPGYVGPGPTYFSLRPRLGQPRYQGQVVVLVNEKTQSYGELTAMLLQALPGVVLLGSQTAGADGNVASVTFPGGLTTYYSSIGVYYPDGRETQRVGILPTQRVEPSLAGIQAGKDELVEQALVYIMTH
jgi:C-terminal processing protease CtpA/Prc